MGNSSNLKNLHKTRFFPLPVIYAYGDIKNLRRNHSFFQYKDTKYKKYPLIKNIYI